MAAPTRKNAGRTLAAVVLAAGKGKRLSSDVPKVLHPVAGRPLLWHTLQVARAARPDRIVVVVGHGADDVREAVSSWGLTPEPVFVEQADQLGTGHAAQLAEAAVSGVDTVLIANGDFDPITPADLKRLLASHRRTGAAVTLGSTVVDRPGGFGRVVREGSRVTDVIEGVDASPAVRRIGEVATNWIAFRRDLLYATLPLLDRDNRQREYYLNRAISILLDKGERIDAIVCDTGGLLGANTRAGLAALQALVRRRTNEQHMAAGVTLLDPDATYVDVDVRIGRDTTILPNTFVASGVRIGVGCTIGPSVEIVDSRVGDRSVVRFSVLEGAKVGRDCEVGPFARLRPGAVLDDGAQVGNYVEVKGSRIGKRSKAKHLAYIGNAELGAGVNVGAGTVFVNYDGYEKHETTVGDGARIGSDTMLVAPLKVGKGAVTGAGSVITKDVPAGALAVERGEQTTVPGYRRRADEKR
ncbi:MAG TPA: bifunctional UDP-N-acetylglucosamine diphosphorylase/glucosamine-1-phosphate N-acetyltransferase GlmU, partial [Actinomycetota bacterium]|nr:bifunctional UDP-N-acetylglucosamine diphosphorylase/glucosamine-1-phosphate N-acetyltransferase GlmU [Actinomycetota bacterium]